MLIIAPRKSEPVPPWERGAAARSRPRPRIECAVGPRIGPKIGGRAGPAFGPGADQIAPAGASFPIDSGSGKGVPLTQADWTNVASASGTPARTVSHSWGFQDAAGNVVATVGTDLTVAGVFEYLQAVAGWARPGLQFTNNTADAATHAGGVGVNPAVTSCLWLGYIDVTVTAAAARNLFSGGGAAGASEIAFRKAATTEVPQIKVMGITADGVNDITAGGVHPCVLRYNRTAGTADIFTEAEKRTGTYNAGVTDGVKGFGQNATVSAGMIVLLGAVFAGADAEWTDNQLRSVLQTLNWTVLW